jgi:hypothetical protein
MIKAYDFYNPMPFSIFNQLSIIASENLTITTKVLS